MTRRDIAAKHLHEARCNGCTDGPYSGQHRQKQIELNYPDADALLTALDIAEDAR